MKLIRPLPHAFCLLLLILGMSVPADAGDTLRQEIGKPLQAAQDLMKQQKYREALAKINEADAMSNKTPYESFIVERMRGAAASGAGDADTAAKAFEAVIASGKLPNDESLKIMQSMAGMYYRAKDYSKAINWAQRYQKGGGTDSEVGSLVAQSYYLSGDYLSAAHELHEQLSKQEKTGKAPSEEQFQLLASCYLKQEDHTGYVNTLQQMIVYYPKKEYWVDVLNQVQRKPGFSDRYALDVYRLMQATGTLTQASDYMEMAQLALQAGYPAEAQRILSSGYSNKVLGTGADTERQKRLKDLADKQAAEDQKTLESDTRTARAKDANAMLKVGYNLVLNAKADDGIDLMEQAIAKGGLKNPDEGYLHVGEAYLLAGKVQEAIKMFKAVQGKDGSQDLAQLWLAFVRKGADS